MANRHPLAQRERNVKRPVKGERKGLSNTRREDQRGEREREREREIEIEREESIRINRKAVQCHETQRRDGESPHVMDQSRSSF